MRLLFALCLALVACYADPTTLPDAAAPDAGPCGGACGPGTVCSGGACVAVDGGALDAGSAADVGEDRPVVVDLGAADVGSDAGFDAGPADTGTDAAPLDAGDAGPFRPMLPDGSHYHPIGPCELCGAMNATCVCGDGGLIYTCREGFAECDGQYANGCETNLTNNAEHCGACRYNCFGGTCRASQCR